MPGLIRADATCPECGDGLLGLVDTTSLKEVRREFFHEKQDGKPRRPPCKITYTDYEQAQSERRKLEVSF